MTRITIGDYVIDRFDERIILTKKVGGTSEMLGAFRDYDLAIDRLLEERSNHTVSDNYNRNINKGLEALSARYKVARLVSRRRKLLRAA